MKHRILKCTACRKIIEQCRCMEKNKAVEYAICVDCQKEGVKSETPDPSGN